MSLETKKYRLIQRMMRLRKETAVDELETILHQKELQERTEESLHAIDSGQVISLDEFGNRNQKWLKNASTKYGR